MSFEKRGVVESENLPPKDKPQPAFDEQKLTKRAADKVADKLKDASKPKDKIL